MSVSFVGFVAHPPIDPQVQQWFMSVDADKSGRITAIELQQALVNANWSHFNPETCRLMIGEFKRLLKTLPVFFLYTDLVREYSFCKAFFYTCIFNYFESFEWVPVINMQCLR